MPDVSARVLFVEDDAGLAGIVVRHLRAHGHDARSVESAEDAIELLRAGFRPNVVLLDINLPGASGWDLLRSGSLKGAGSPPVYVVTATNVPPARLREFDVAGLLPKPFAMPTLIEVVERCAREQQVDEETIP
jgi:DNA-binding response OmpR family regulator